MSYTDIYELSEHDGRTAHVFLFHLIFDFIILGINDLDRSHSHSLAISSLR
jgi:hypothetical protein